MSPAALQRLSPGTLYLVRTKTGRATKRIFKGVETREPFGIACAVFTTRVRTPVTVDAMHRRTVRYPRRHVPRGELSVPHYELMTCIPIMASSIQGTP